MHCRAKKTIDRTIAACRICQSCHSGSVVVLSPWLLILAYGILGALIIVRNPVQIGGDEGMEFAKSMLVARDFNDISKVWNDQPWFYSCMFGLFYKMTGFLASLPRLFSLACSLIFCCRLRHIMPVSAGPVHHAAAVGLFLTFSGVLVLTVSGMCEL